MKEFITIVLTKSENEDFGLTFFRDNKSNFLRGPVISLVKTDSNALKAGLKFNDEIIACNGVSLQGRVHESNMKILKSSGKKLRLIVLREKFKQKPPEVKFHREETLYSSIAELERVNFQK